MRRALAIGLVTWATAACNPATQVCPVGRERCPCTLGGGCDPGLVCGEGICRPGAEAKAGLPMRGMSIELPKARSGESIQPVLVVSCTASGEVFLDGEAMAGDEDLTAAVRARLVNDPNVQGIVACDQKADVGELVRLIDRLREAGVEHYAIATAAQLGAPEPVPIPEPEPEPPPEPEPEPPPEPEPEPPPEPEPG